MANRETIGGFAARLLLANGDALFSNRNYIVVKVPDGQSLSLGIWDNGAKTMELFDVHALADAVLATRLRTVLTVDAKTIGADVLAAAMARVAIHARWAAHCPKDLSEFRANAKPEATDAWCEARRQQDGTIRVSTRSRYGHLRLTEAEAASLRDQLDVALHVPAPDRPIDPPSRL